MLPQIYLAACAQYMPFLSLLGFLDVSVVIPAHPPRSLALVLLPFPSFPFCTKEAEAYIVTPE